MRLPQRAHISIAPLDAGMTYLELDEVTSVPLKTGIAWWRMARGERPYPSRQELNPREMTATLPHMSLVKVIDGGADFEHRIVGDVVVQTFNLTIQHRRFSEIAGEAPEFIASCFALFRAVVDTGSPCAWLSRSHRESFEVIYTMREIVLLPLGRSSVEYILGFGSAALSADPH